MSMSSLKAFIYATTNSVLTRETGVSPKCTLMPSQYESQKLSVFRTEIKCQQLFSG